jgi:hypothetical protein
MINVEINGPGEAVINEIAKLRRETTQMVDRTADGKITYDLRYVLTHMREFLYSRVDSLRPTYARHSRTSFSNKFGRMAAFKDSFELRRFEIKSMFLLDEMKTVVVNGGSVDHEPGKHDDRVISAALAHESWKKWVQPQLESARLTYASVMAEERGEGPNQAQKIGINYLRRAGILPKDGIGEMNV